MVYPSQLKTHKKRKKRKRTETLPGLRSCALLSFFSVFFDPITSLLLLLIFFFFLETLWTRIHTQTHMAHVAPKALHKRIKGTNVEVRKEVTDDNTDAQLALLYSIAADDETELRWFHNTFRPERNLVHPSDAFLQGIKALRPAAVFNTFDVKKAKLRRLTKHEKDKASAMVRRKKEMAPTAAYKAAVNPHKTPRTGGQAPVEEVRVLSRGMNKAQKARSRARAARKAGKASGGSTNEPKTYFTKWKKRKQEKIGRGL